MFSGINRLGEQQDDVPDVDEEGDIDFIATNFMSPDSGYPSQRYGGYDDELVQHETLNDDANPVSKIAAPFNRNYFGTVISTMMKTMTGAPRNMISTGLMTPRYAPKAESPQRRPEPWFHAIKTAMPPRHHFGEAIRTVAAKQYPIQGSGRSWNSLIPFIRR